MSGKSSQADIELPLLSKGQKQEAESNSSHFKTSHRNQSKPKYFETGLINRAVFGWVDGFLSRPQDSTFQQEDHYNLRTDEECGNIADKFYTEWENTKGQTHPLIRTQYRAFRSSVWTSQLFALIDTCCGFTGPLLVAGIIRYIQSSEPELAQGFLLIILFVASRIGVILANSQNTQYLTVLQNKILKGTLSLIYKKSLQFPLMRSHDISAGNIMTYMLVDAENLCKIFFLMPQLVQFPILLVIGIGILYRAVGIAFIAGGITVVLTGFVISWLTKITFEYQKKVMTAKDVRMKRTNEILVGIKYVKMCGTEKNFLESVNKDREQEVHWIKQKNYLSALRIITFWLSPVLLSISVFGCYILFNGNLTPEKTFVVLSTISILQGPLNNIGQVLNDLLQAIVSLKRVQQFMFNGEVDTSYIIRSKQASSPVALAITNGNFYWLNKQENKEEDAIEPPSSGDFLKGGYKLILKDINMIIPKGSFVAILGDVGSGKSSLFNSVLGEMIYDSKHPPRIELNGSVAYMAQKPWITNATIKENIIFDNVYDEYKYKEALRTSCLKADLKTLIKQDQTEIGEKGVNLSGGQKARVALARAIYSDCDIYLLDDPLSAVDAHVAKYILEECLTKKLRDKTRVLVTHKLESLKYVDYIYLMKAGEVIAEGTFEAIRKTAHYKEIEEKSNKEVENNQDEQEEEEAQHEEEFDAKKSLKKISEKILKESEKKSMRKETSFHEGQEQKEMLERLMLNEDRQTGAVSWAIWKSFFNYFGSVQFFIVLMTAIVFWLGLKTLSDFWLAHWSNNSSTDTEHGNGYYYGIYMILTLSSVALLFVRMIMAVIGGVGVSKRLHYDMFVRVIRAPINLFFDRVPLGRLINRFASDLDIVDNTMPFTLSRIAFMPVDIIAKVVVCCIAGTVWVLPLACLFVWMGFKIQQRYFSVYREAFRLSRITSSPITSMVAESLDGLTQIRSLEYQDKFLKKFAVRQNEHMKNLILLAGLWGWFSFRVNIASLMIVGPTIAAAILLSHQLSGSAGLIGLLVTYLLDLSGIMTFLLYQYSLFESNLISFERCRAFTKVEVENEANTSQPVANYSRSSWPEAGEIEFKNYYAKYRPNLPFVLKDVSFKIFGSEKIGVVGRTGSGKSTTLLALLRIIEPHAGKIFIDNADISQIGLDDLRKKITIIPQDPLLYKGTLKQNLDLLGIYSEAQMWKALEKVCMKNKFLEAGLESEIKEGGENLSAGEKQLICIARAILNKNKIILVDEATSSIDNVTEEAILESIRENFKDCTVITIAHRLKTIISSDRILFMQDGRVAEFDTPKHLLSNKNGLFYTLWKEYEAAKA